MTRKYAIPPEMVDGYRDGFDLGSPEPSSNRSHSYRHGFTVGRADRNGKPAFGSAKAASEAAQKAIAADIAHDHTKAP